MSRDIDQEVSDTLSTLLSFDEDNFLSQEEVEENLRNCPNIEHVSSMEKIYQNYNDNPSTSVRLNHTNDEEVGVTTYVCEKENVEIQKPQKQLDAFKGLNVDSHTIYSHTEDVTAVNKEIASQTLNGDFAEEENTCLSKYPNDLRIEADYESKEIGDGKLQTASVIAPIDVIKSSIIKPNDIKMEFTCETEKILEEQIGDYYIEEQYKDDINLNCAAPEVEIGNVNAIIDKNDINSNKQHNDLLNNAIPQQDSHYATNDEFISNVDNDSDISHIMNDHNYTSQSQLTNGDSLRKLLFHHIYSREDCSSTALNLVNDFVDRTLESINTFSTQEDKDNKISKVDTLNLIDIFVEEKSSKCAIFDGDLKTLAHKNPAELVVTDETSKKNAEFDDEINSTASSKTTANSNENITMNVSSIPSLQEICSEPLEHALQGDCSNKSSTITDTESKNKTCFDYFHKNSHTYNTTSDKTLQNSEPKIEAELKIISFGPLSEKNCSKTLDNTKSESSVESKNAATAMKQILENASGQICAKPAIFCANLEKFNNHYAENDDVDLDTTTGELLVKENSAKQLTMDSTTTNEINKLATECKEKESFPQDDVDFKTVNIASVPSPIENCSEPMEHSTFDEAFDINCNEKLTVIHHLETLKSFAKSLQNDCDTFTSSTTTIENKLQKYLQEQFEIFKRIVKSSAAVRYEDKSMQTDNRLSKNKLRKLNQSNKHILLDATDSDSSSDTSKMEAFIKLPGNRIRIKSSTKNSEVNAGTQMLSAHKKESIAAEYDDGVPLAEYTQSEIFETETFCSENFTNIRNVNKKNNLSDSDVSEERDTWQRKKSSTDGNSVRNGAQNESDKENSAGKTLSSKNSQNEGDKEIERLINLNGLIKRTNLGAPKSADLNEKVKTKSTTSKNKDIADDYTDDDIQPEIFSDASISESEEEIITEKQFLKRCNENVKQQLLSESDSETSESDVSDNIEEILSSNEGSSSPLVERFLKNFNVNESDEETEVYDKTGDMKTPAEQEITDVKNTTTDKNKTNSSENSDCEVLDEMVASTQKQSKPKSLEKMLSVVEKRKKMNRLCDSISLSSESESSDVEAVDESKSRIKPMLRPEQLATVTREAQRNETERIRRLEKKHKVLAKLLKERPDVQGDNNLILDYNDETKTFIKVHPDIVKYLKQHQRDGVKFMYDSCYGGVEALKKSSGSGCILAHCMGLGKTLQLIALLHTVISYKELKTSKVLVLCPKSTVMNWADEIDRWLGPLKPKYYTFHDTSDINDKIQILKDWSQATANAAGILLIGYEAFRTLVFYHSYKNRSIAQSRLESIRNDVDKYLLSPGADLVVCDEGHIIKNSKSAISLAVSQIKTQKRIVLTGTPIQNNLKEYYSMVNFIKPLFLGTEKEFANLYANPIKNGQHKDSSKRDIQVMKQRSFVLHKKLSKFVQRKEAELLKTFLPQKYEYVLFVPMTKVQTVLYEHSLAIISKKDDRGKGLITDYTCLRKIWTHPKVLEDAWKNATAQKHKKDPRKNQAVNSDDDQPDDVYDSQTGVISVTNDWWRSLLTEKDLEAILPSNKLRTMFEILRMCEEKGEKCLIFSAFVAVLNVVEYFFKKMNDKDRDTLNELKMSQGYQVKNTWILGKDYYRLDGKTPKLIRHEMIEQFNSISNKRARVFLISSRAGGQGINLTGANRVIILDTSWNPSNDQQNIFRVFRLGQKKNCYIYRLLAMGTMEEKVYSRSVTKQAMSFRVVDEQQIDRHYSMAELTELYSLTQPDYENRPMPDCPQDSILASLLLNYPSLVYKYHEHDSLLENKVEQELSEQEKQDAWAAYERDQQLSTETRELPNPDDLQNNLSAPKFPSYMGSLNAFNQMSALFNYGNYSPAALSSYLPYLSHLGNYTTNQQYLEMRKRIAEGTFPYPDISTSLGGAAFGTPYAQNPPKSLATNPLIPDLNMHSNPLQTNPLSALGDLSMFGLGAVGNHMSHNVNTPTLPPRQHNSPTYPSTTPPTASSLQANYDYQMYENSLKSLVNYRHDFSGNGNKSKGATNAPVNQFRNPLYPSPTNLSFDKNALTSLNSPSPKAMEPPAQKSQADKTTPKTATDLSLSIAGKNNFSVTNSSGARSSPLPQVASKRSFPSDVAHTTHTTNLIDERLTPNQKSAKETQQQQQSGMPTLASFQTSFKTSNAPSGSSIFTNKNTSVKIPSDNNMSTNPEMQIIPTTSPPGSTSIPKHLSDISPSISLTAVTNTNTSSAHKQQTFNQSKLQTKNPTNNKVASSANNTSESPTPTLPFTASKFFENNKKSLNRTISKPTNAMTKTKLTPNAESILKSASTSTSAQSAQNSFQPSAAELASKLLTMKNKNILQRKSPSVQIQPIKSSTTTTTTTQNSLPTTLAAVKALNGNLQTPPTKPGVQTLQSDARKAALAMDKRLPTLITPAKSATSVQVHKAPLGAGTLKIQPSSSKQSSSSSSPSDNKYILETCINQKKFVIGAPTKGGGGTTVTRVQQQGKRKMPEIMSKDMGSNESKRSK
ncbi:transcriptional regulator ATRX-like [Bactrocera neohumeralis]|uniref:transcriptional regulator ATRX-like n=1 Tax=Bactrocera neohumeralis TaxID=98809 RepID=UPI0021661166|nr:transcriptional regulator ATRX-like [Bactrocera neohumeralis]